MQRDIRNEVWTAVLLVLLLGAVALSAILLTTLEPEVEPTGTPVEIISNVEDTTATATTRDTSTVTSTVTSPPDTPTPTTTHTPTSTPTLTSTATASNTPTSSPTRTETSTATASITPSRTQRPKNTVIPSPTVGITATPTHVNTSTPTPSRTPIPLAAVTTEPCTPPDDWVIYTVEAGNTLFSIARAVGSTVGELRTVNCISDADNIGVGEALFVPRSPNGPVRTGVPQLPDESTVVSFGVEGCGVPASRISNPAPGAGVRGLFSVSGTASLENFQYYRLEVRPDFTNVYNFYSRSDQQVTNGVLGQVNAELFDDGLHWVRLTVVDTTGNFIQPCAIPVIFE